MSLTTTYLPGNTVIHRLPAGIKLVLLAATGVALTVLNLWWEPVAVLSVVLACYLLAGFPVRTLAAQLRSMSWVLLAISVFQLVVSGWQSMVDVIVTLAAMVLAAGLVSLTTGMEALTEVLLRILRPFRRFGVAPERMALLISLSVRSVSVIAGLAQEVRDAQRARGLGGSARAFAVPLLVRSLRHAEALGEALIARGLDD
jgi:biotin transport system permease protein